MKKLRRELTKLNFEKQTIVKLNDLRKLVGGLEQPVTVNPTIRNTRV
jgi:hypothetical protein